MSTDTLAETTAESESEIILADMPEDCELLEWIAKRHCQCCIGQQFQPDCDGQTDGRTDGIYHS